MGRMILVEGLDLAGKSTLIENLKRHHPGPVRLRNGQFCENNPTGQVAREMVRWDEGFGGVEAGALFLSSMLWDARHFEPPGAELHLQDSCWLRTLAFEQLYGSAPLARLMEEQGRKFPRFDRAIFLTASLEERLRRLHRRSNNDLHDQLAFKKPEKFLAIEKRLLELVVEWEKAMVIDTTEMSKDEVFEQGLRSLFEEVSLRH